MRLESVTIRNFKGFDQLSFDLDENFTTFVGENGQGKTSVLEALSLLVAPWAWGVGQGKDTDFSDSFVRIESSGTRSSVVFRPVFPMQLIAVGRVWTEPFEWMLEASLGKATYGDVFGNGDSIKFREKVRKVVESENDSQVWPIIAFYRADRAEKRDAPTDWNALMSHKAQRLDGYKDWNSPEVGVKGFAEWMGRQEAIAFRRNSEAPIYRTVLDAVLGCLPAASNLMFDAEQGEPIVVWKRGGASPFSQLSHGQRSILAMVGDIARRAALLNPHLENSAPAETPGVVLVDELDLHLHPLWQRKIVDDLKRTFPRIQFITTTHSPFIIQSLEAGELFNLDDKQPETEYVDLSLEEIAASIMGVENPQRSQKHNEMMAAASDYFSLLREGRTKSPAQLAAARAAFEKRATDFQTEPAPALGAIARLHELATESKRQRGSAALGDDEVVAEADGQ